MFEVNLADGFAGICVIKQNNPGIISMKVDKIYCFTCRKNYCEHAKHVNELKGDDENLPEFVDRFINIVKTASGSTRNKTVGHTVYSNQKISFLTNDNITSVLKKLATIDQVSSLSVNKTVCECGSVTLNQSVLYETSDIITLTSLSKVKGMYFVVRIDEIF